LRALKRLETYTESKHENGTQRRDLQSTDVAHKRRQFSHTPESGEEEN
jgi:hypothetical protein